jgi:3-oxoacyl-[acyl-carrier protein] reductase
MDKAWTSSVCMRLPSVAYTRWWRWIKREVPMKRFGTPQEIGDTAAFLLSERASFINGAVIAVDGGQTR